MKQIKLLILVMCVDCNILFMLMVLDDSDQFFELTDRDQQFMAGILIILSERLIKVCIYYICVKRDGSDKGLLDGWTNYLKDNSKYRKESIIKDSRGN